MSNSESDFREIFCLFKIKTKKHNNFFIYIFAFLSDYFIQNSFLLELVAKFAICHLTTSYKQSRIVNYEVQYSFLASIHFLI